MELKNLTPHPITIVDEHGNALATIASVGAARADRTNETVGHVTVAGHQIEVVRPKFGAVSLPDPQPGVMLIVSLIAAQAAQAAGRTTDDLLIVSDLVKDANGNVAGCMRFAQI